MVIGDYTPSPCKIGIISHYQPKNFTQMTKMLRSNPRQGVKEITVACCNHVSSIEFSEFGAKIWSIWPISDEVIPLANEKAIKIYFAVIGSLPRW